MVPVTLRLANILKDMMTPWLLRPSDDTDTLEETSVYVPDNGLSMHIFIFLLQTNLSQLLLGEYKDYHLFFFLSWCCF